MKTKPAFGKKMKSPWLGMSDALAEAKRELKEKALLGPEKPRSLSKPGMSDTYVRDKLRHTVNKGLGKP
jgi:hypothetical protein